jgi:putative hydrolase of the HAD superfamily
VAWRAGAARLRGEVDSAIFCRDVGWRKPASPIFRQAMARVGCEPDECLFVGDEPRWDLIGPRSLGMPAALIDRSGALGVDSVPRVVSLAELVDRVSEFQP